MVVAISNIVAGLGGIGLIVALIWIARSGHHDREAEEAARRYFDEHGHWPDEAPGEP
ncbi:MAG TPA: hypothetical protein VM266_11745 [Solirubrobacteraceae bacterium]|nr:hypothetical protein [Solirubrobacteraceae bacterium]